MAATPSSRAEPYLRAAVLALACYVAGRVGLSLAFVQANASPVWPPSGVALAGLLLLGIRYWPAVYVAAVAVTLGTGAPLLLAMLTATGNVLDAVIGAWLLSRVFRIRPSLSGVRDVLRFVPLGALPGPAVSAVIGAGTLLGWGVLSWEGAAHTALVWWTGNATGVLVAAPVVLAWSASRRPLSRARALELGLAATGAVGVTFLAFASRDPFPAAQVPLSYAVFPFVTWAAMRGGQRGASIVTAAVAFSAVAAVSHALEEPGSPFAAQNSLLFLQGYLALVSITGMVLAALTHERRSALKRERRARRNAQSAERRQALLAEVGAVLSGSLEYPETLAKLASLVVPRLADGCIIDELTDDGAFGRMVTLHRDPAIDRLLADTRRLYPPPSNPNSRVAAAMRSGRTDFLAEVDASFAERLAVDDQHRAILAGLAIRSVMFVPLVARERCVGVLTLMRTDGARPYTRRDVALAEEVARRAALYVDNARLYRSVRSEAAARQKVVSMVSHEVRNPLSTILLNASALLDEGAVDGQRPSIEAVVLAAEQINHLVQDLADVTRLEAGSLPVGRAAFRPCLLLREAAMLLEPLAARKGLRFGARTGGELPWVVGDRDRTLQVLGNLVGNAVRYTPAGGEIEVRAEAVDGVVRFCVADTGSGIAPEALGELFLPLWSGEVPARGMGLPLSRAIVEAQGGRLWAESTPGQGSRFFFTLPVEGSGDRG